MATIFYIVVLTFFAYKFPMKTWYALVLISVGGILGMLELVMGFKPWVLWTLELFYGLLGFKLLFQKRYLDIFKYRFAFLLLLTGSWLYIYGIIVNFSFQTFWVHFHGGLMAIFILAHLQSKSMWKGITTIIGIHLFLSYCVFYLDVYIPWIGIIDGVHYNQNTDQLITYSGEFARGLIGGGSGNRGGGVYLNSNVWAQLGGWGAIVGVATFLVGKGKSLKVYGLSLGTLGVLGLLGSMGRAAIFAAIVSLTLLILSHIVKRNALLRIIIGLVVAFLGIFLVNYAINLSKISNYEIVSNQGADYRIENFFIVWKNFSRFWVGGRQGQGHPFDPHDILGTSFYNFGILGLIVVVFCILGGFILTWKWLVNGEKAIGPFLGMPIEYEAIASLSAVPLFIFYIISSLGNGIAGGIPYTNLFFLFGYFGWNTLRSKQLVRNKLIQSIRHKQRVYS